MRRRRRRELEWGVQQACFQMKTICGGRLYKQAIQINHLRKSRGAKERGREGRARGRWGLVKVCRGDQRYYSTTKGKKKR